MDNWRLSVPHGRRTTYDSLRQQEAHQEGGRRRDRVPGGCALSRRGPVPRWPRASTCWPRTRGPLRMARLSSGPTRNVRPTPPNSLGRQGPVRHPVPDDPARSEFEFPKPGYKVDITRRPRPRTAPHGPPPTAPSTLVLASVEWVGSGKPTAPGTYYAVVKADGDDSVAGNNAWSSSDRRPLDRGRLCVRGQRRPTTRPLSTPAR